MTDDIYIAIYLIRILKMFFIRSFLLPRVTMRYNCRICGPLNI
jgi:hypothetical protein